MNDPRAELPQPSIEPPPARVLVVEDDPGPRRLLLHTLNALGYVAEAAENGTQALEMIAAKLPQIVLLDLDLPGLNGAEVCARIRHHVQEEVRNIPVLMLTAHDGEREEVACLHAGANDFLAKPIGRAALAARIATQLRLRSLNDTLRAQNEELERWRAAQIADLDAAWHVQRAILPTPEKLPDWTIDIGFFPLIQVSGDIYGIEPTRAGPLVWLADATGHGVAAALCTTMVALLFQRAAITADPGTALARVNADLLRIFGGRLMMSAACALLLPDGGLRFAGAGHPPLLVRRSDGRVESTASRGILLGLLPDQSYSSDDVALARGDTALLLTDGLHGVRRPDGERATIDDIVRLLAQNGTVSTLVEQARAGDAFDDDATAITLRPAS